MGGLLRMFSFSLVVSAYMMTYTTWQVQFAANERLTDWLAYHSSSRMFPVLEAAGIWSIEDVACRSIASLPHYITKNRDVLNDYRYLKEQACAQLMLPLWLNDHGLENYANIHDHIDLVTLSGKYPGEIFMDIKRLQHLGPSDRVSLRKDVQLFKSAVGKFINGHMRSVEVMAHKEKYEKLLVSWNWRYGPKLFESFVKIYKVQWLQATAFMFISLLVLWLSLPHGLPLHGSYVLPLLSTYWFVPEWGKMNILSMLFLRSFKEPIRLTILSGILYIWTMAANDVIKSPYVLLFSVLPTVAFTMCINSLRCQPSVVTEESSGLFDLTISGIGHIEKEIRTFARGKKVSWLYAKLACVGTLHNLKWDKIQRIKIEEVDASWEAIKDVIRPSIESNSLKVIWLADNYAITNKDAKSIAKLISENKALDTLRITFNRRPSILDLFSRLLLWNQNPVGFTNEGALELLEIISDAEGCNLKTLDLCGVHLKQSFVKKITETPKLKNINILVNKRMVTDNKPRVEIMSYILKKLCLLVILTFTLTSFTYIVHPSTIAISTDTWLTRTFEQTIYPHLHNYIPPYLQNPSLQNIAYDSSYS